MSHLHKHESVLWAGKPLHEAKRFMVMLHGRGASAANILMLADELDVEDFALAAPQATFNTWYPYSFLAPTAQNEPGLSSALDLLAQLREQLHASGLEDRQIYWVGFSQGACLTAEFCARHAAPYGGIFMLTGGLIGDRLDLSRYQGAFEGCPAFFGTSDLDPHVPLTRVQESVSVFENLGAAVTLKVYPGMPHTVNEDEIREINGIIKRLS